MFREEHHKSLFSGISISNFFQRKTIQHYVVEYLQYSFHTEYAICLVPEYYKT